MSDPGKKIADLSPAQRAVLNQRLQEKKNRPGVQDVIGRRTATGSAPLSFAQERLWFLDQFQPNNAVYNIPLELRLKGELDAAVLRRCLDELVRRHETLRSRFDSVEGRPVQVIEPAVALEMPMTDLSSLAPGRRDAEVDRLRAEEAVRPFDLRRDLMLRVHLLRLAPADHLLLMNMHHIASDGWSMGVIFSELKSLYAAFIEGKPSPLPELPIQYADYAAWQRQWLQGEVLEKQLSFWMKQLEGAPDLLELPTDRPRPPMQSYRGAVLRRELPPALVAALKELSRTESATLFMTLLAAFQILLHRYTGSDDIVVGSPMAGRNRTEVENLIGFFINAVALRGDLSGDPTFRAFLSRARETSLAAFAHQDLPFEKLVEALKSQRDASHSPLFQVLFVLQNAPAETAQLKNLEVTSRLLHTGTSKFDLTLSIRELGEALDAEIEYNTDIFDDATITRLLGHYQTLIEGIVAQPDRRLSELPLLGAAERHQLLVEWNQTECAYPRDKCIHELFEEQAAHAPDAVAALFQEESLSYRQLNERAEQVARHLRAMGIGPGALVGLLVERSLEMLIGVLGILKAGGAYWALEEKLPEERRQRMLADARPKVVLFRRKAGAPFQVSNVPLANAPKFVSIEELLESPSPDASAPASRPQAGDPAYVNYTSGSTGQPKGVLVPHRGVVRLVKGADYVSLSAEETLLHLSPLSFDASTFEIWGALLNGGRVVLMPPGPPTLAEIGEAIRRDGVTTAWLTAGLFHLMVDERLDDLKPLRQLLAGGDVLSPEHVRRARRALPGCRIVNGYGPTENTTFTCCYTVRDERDLSPSVPIGRPIANTQAYILDPNREPVPVGVPGELYAGGDGVACGYLNQPELTAQKFVPDPFSGRAGARLYRTGDLARFRADGNIDFLGRLDHQVKIRGFRVELGEIEEMLNRHSAVRTSAVVVRGEAPGDKRLIAYVVNQNGALSNSELRDYLGTRLPDYMVPSAFVSLAALPLNANGKVDRKALPNLELEPVDRENAFAPPTTPTEIALAEVWCEVFGLGQVGVRDDFFEMGGHSLLAVRLISKIKSALFRDVPIPVFFQNPTVGKLAAYLDRENRAPRAAGGMHASSPSAEIVAFQEKGDRPPLFFHHGDWLGGGLYCGRLSQNLGDNQPFYALSPFRSEMRTVTMEEMAAHHVAVIREHTPHGPYLVGGYCVGATVATEIARKLVEQGEEVVHLLLIDPPLVTSRLHRLFWALTERWGDLLNWDLEKKITCFDRYFVPLDRWLKRSPSSKLVSIGRRLGLVKAEASEPRHAGGRRGRQRRWRHPEKSRLCVLRARLSALHIQASGDSHGHLLSRGNSPFAPKLPARA